MSCSKSTSHGQVLVYEISLTDGEWISFRFVSSGSIGNIVFRPISKFFIFFLCITAFISFHQHYWFWTISILLYNLRILSEIHPGRVEIIFNRINENLAKEKRHQLKRFEKNDRKVHGNITLSLSPSLSLFLGRRP